MKILIVNGGMYNYECAEFKDLVDTDVFIYDPGPKGFKRWLTIWKVHHANQTFLDIKTDGQSRTVYIKKNSRSARMFPNSRPLDLIEK